MLERASVATERAKEFLVNTGSILSKAQSLVSGDSQIFFSSPKSSEIRQMLCSDSIHDKMYGMKVITAKICKGSDMRAFFPDVVKNIHEPSMELRKLIYMFVVHYAHTCPNEALLSISAFQKDLTDMSMHVRALALRMLSSINLATIHPVVMVAVRKGAKDQAPIVRKAAAIALLKAHAICKNDLQLDSIYQILQDLLADPNTDVMGTAIVVFQRIARDREEFLHPIFRRICRELPNFDEWTQEVVLRVLLRYARHQFNDPALPTRPAGDPVAASASSASSVSSSSAPAVPPAARPGEGGRARERSPDHDLLLRAVRPLLTSLNAAVVVGVCAVLHHAGPPGAVDEAVCPLLRVYRNAREGREGLLHVLYALIQARPGAFRPYLGEFFLFPNDSLEVQEVKHRVLASLVDAAEFAGVEGEYGAYLRGVEPRAVAAAVHGLGRICRRHPALAPRVMRRLLRLLLRPSQGNPRPGNRGAEVDPGDLSNPRALQNPRHPTADEEDGGMTTAAVAVLRLLVAAQRLPGGDRAAGARVVFRLLQEVMRGALARPEALATVLWLVGENLSYHVAMAAAAPECFRVFVRKFPTLETNVKEEVLRLGCKIWLHLEGKGELVERFRKIFTFALELATYDDYYAIQDHARLFQGALERDSDTFKALKATLLSEKSPPTVSEPHPAGSSYELGTFSHLWGHPVVGYEELPPWRVEPPDDSVRIPPGEAALESRPEHIDDFVGRSSRSLSLDEDDSREEEGSEDDVETSETGGSSTASDESSTESSESSSEEERDSTASGSGRSSAGNRTASASNAAVTAVREKIMVRFSKTVHSEVTPSPLKSPMQAAPPTFSTPPPDASEQTAAEHVGDLEDDES